MDLKIDGRNALIAASGRGLGLATATCLAGEGAHVVLCDKDENALKTAKSNLASEVDGQKVDTYLVDLTNPKEIDTMFKNINQDLGPISILVTNSGGPPPGNFDHATDNHWDASFSLTFLSAVRLIRNALPAMKEQRWGRIINFTSRALKEPIPGLMLSNAMRLAVAGMAKTLALEVAQYGITVNNICPGPTTTERALELAQNRALKKGISIEEELKLTAQNIPMGRLAMPEEPAAIATFLASELAGYITGISILVDGGAVKAL